MSLSARRAWIEIVKERIDVITITVALRKESVDRNVGGKYDAADHAVSLSARRAWIEIGINPNQSGKTDVALRKESVDRNS